MRISDWSSDVCSSDLCVGRLQQTVLGGATCGLSAKHGFQGLTTGVVGCRPSSRARLGWNKREVRWDNERSSARNGEFVRSVPVEYTPARTTGGKAERSEEHTSELQSLMRISYAVFCLKKKN